MTELDAAVFLLRWLAGGILIFAGLAKLLSFRRLTRRLWRPRWVSFKATQVSLALVLAAEILLGIVVSAGLVERVIPVSLMLGCSFALLTAYGSVAVSRSGNCGCGLPGARLSLLWARNAALFGAAAVGLIYGPSFETLLQNDADLAAAVGVVPLALLLAGLMLRAISDLARGVTPE
jgi:hypothetical protein